MDNVLPDAYMDRYRHIVFCCLCKNAYIFIWKIPVKYCFSHITTHTGTGLKRLVDNVIYLPCFFPKTKSAIFDVAGDTFSSLPDHRKLEIMDHSRTVGSDARYKPSFHEIYYISLNTGPNDMGTHHQNNRRAVFSSTYNFFPSIYQLLMNIIRRFQIHDNRQIQIIVA